MPILIVGNPIGDLDQVKNDLLKICPDPGLTFKVIASVTFEAREVQYSPTMSSVGCNLVAQLSSSSAYVMIASVTGALKIPNVTNTNLVLADRAGYTVYESYPAGDVNIAYDGQSGGGCNGRGYWVEGIVNGISAQVDMPTDVILFHQLTHARNLIAMSFSNGLASAEADALVAENQYRAQRNPALPQRTGVSGGCKPAPPKQPPAFSGKGQSKPSGGCFVATAALESEHDEKLDFLRTFRDRVLRSTRRGADYFDAFYRYYYQVSPPIANSLRADSELRHLMLTAFVLPLVNYLKLAVAYPCTALPAGLPEDWRAFLEALRDDMEAWGRKVMPPLEAFPEDYAPEDVASDIDFVMRYILRSPESKAAYQAILDQRRSPWD